MSENRYDVIVVGARCAGSPTAMLLARRGYRVLVVDRARFPSDTVSTHLVHPPGVAALRRWGLLDRLIATDCPPIHTYSFDFGPFALAGAPGTADSPVAYSPRRTVLDKLLVDAASEAGVEVREGFTASDVIVEDGRVTGVRGHSKGGATVTERARVVIGADGVHSVVARTVRPDQYHDKPRLQYSYYTYYSGLPMDGRFEVYLRPPRAFAVWPTNDDLTLVIGGWPYAEFEANRTDIEGNLRKNFELVPAFAERLRAANREARWIGAAVPNFLRKPFGPGWALVGDAGYNKDFITAQGITDAFRDAELCATALDQALSGTRSFDEAMGDYQATRDDQVLPIYEFTAQLAVLEPPPPDLQQLLGAVHGNQDAMDGFAQVNAGVMSPAEYFSDENVARILATRGRRAS
jgi:2-polyprenyl-6-methoxyphenol hydroxylase-like FAD-dependent oxidoreductase